MTITSAARADHADLEAGTSEKTPSDGVPAATEVYVE
jgi:hypothetical protein